MNSKMANLFSDAGKAICSIDDTSELFLRSLHKSSISLKDTTIITNNSFMLNSAMKINNKRKIYLEF
ncbi:hypothetical protein, partial [Vibrio cholerae]|uniref:hypothetical protein n=1 Tax=Vibrio cholerae TaxID=666 RepID=UPI001F2B5CE9